MSGHPVAGSLTLLVVDVCQGNSSLDVTCLSFLADRTATQYDRLLATACRPSVRLSVTLCIVALMVDVQG